MDIDYLSLICCSLCGKAAFFDAAAGAGRDVPASKLPQKRGSLHYRHVSVFGVMTKWDYATNRKNLIFNLQHIENQNFLTC